MANTGFNSCLGVFFLQNGESLLGYILKTSGHAYVHIVNLSAPSGSPGHRLPIEMSFDFFILQIVLVFLIYKHFEVSLLICLHLSEQNS